MKLLCDEDVGTGIPTALHAVDLPGQSLRRLGMGGAPDVEWLEFAGREGWLVFSYNWRMIREPEELAAIRGHNVGVVIGVPQMRPRDALLLLLRQWDALERLDQAPRPFVRYLGPRGGLRSAYRSLPLV